MNHWFCFLYAEVVWFIWIYFVLYILKHISEISTDDTEDENASAVSAFKIARSEFKNPAKYVERGIFKFHFYYF